MLKITTLIAAPLVVTTALLVGCGSTTSTTYKTSVDHSGHAYVYPTGYKSTTIYYPHSHTASGHYQYYHNYQEYYRPHSAAAHYHTGDKAVYHKMDKS